MTTTRPRVLISGASVAGPALAYWLTRHGFSATVVEKAPGLRRGGYNIDVRGVAVDVAERMGILEGLRAARTGMGGLTFRTDELPDGIDVPVELLSAEEGGRNVEIGRGALCSLLYEASKDDAEYVFGESMTELQQHHDRVSVSFTHRPTEDFDLVVGADGLHSNTRGVAFGPESRYSHHLGAYLSIFTVPNHLGLDRWTVYHNTPGKAVALYTTDPAESKAFTVFASPALAHFDPHDEEGQKRIVADHLADVGWEAPTILEAMWDAEDFYFDALCQIRMPRWTSGRIALVGDAAYGPSPASGQGTSLALVGAYVLAGELARAEGEHTAAFTAYEHRMRDFVQRNQRIADTGRSILLPATRTGLRLRNAFLRAGPLLRRLAWLNRLTDPIAKAANALDLPDYEESDHQADCASPR
jgi:2-polyprenyl-6-methoxyphenol hydroxylase-like FAD-dependent oxidoreductase